MTGTSREAFLAELEGLGYDAKLRGEAFLEFPYTVEVGPLADTTVQVALEPTDHPRTPPSGPFVSPRLLPMHPDSSRPAPYGGVHEAAGRNGFRDPDGAWQYWSRPFNEWGDHGRTARSYLDVHLRRLFAALPEDAEEQCAA
jgi:hypothetical protein